MSTVISAAKDFDTRYGDPKGGMVMGTLTLNERTVRIPADPVKLEGTLSLPERASAVVIFAHGSGSSRLSPRNTFVARVLQNAGIGTLLFDLLTGPEDSVYENRFNIGLLTDRLEAATNWLGKQPDAKDFRLGYFGASTGAAAALIAAANAGALIGAVVSRGGRPDMAGKALGRVQSPTLLIVGGRDDVVIRLNEDAYREITAEKELKIVPGATHLFEEPGTLEEVARLAAEWFLRHLLRQ
jgi:dienelactone hydrolase